jgi:hypothetical protein
MTYNEYIVRESSQGHIFYFNKEMKLHRLDGPAQQFPNGDKRYYIDGDCYSEEEYYFKINLIKELEEIKEISNILES